MIYFLQAGDHVKIGRTKDADTLKRRLVALQTGQAHRLAVIRTIDAPSWVEAWLHGFFAGVCISGEWFQYQPEMLQIEPPKERPFRTSGLVVQQVWDGIVKLTASELRQAIRTLGCQRQVFAAHCDLSPEYLSRLCNGHKRIPRWLDLLVCEWLAHPANPPPSNKQPDKAA